jgi:esterase/lipase superfamily enzyme
LEFKPIPVMSDVAPRIPFYVQSETNEQRIEIEVDPAAFWADLTAEVERSSSQSVILFVHGYSYDFERGCHRAAEVQRALRGDSVVILFSWPSNGRATDYMPDVADLEWSVPALTALIEELSSRVSPDNVHVLSHSLGARGAAMALELLRADHAELPLIGRWVLLAPDLDSATFVDALPRLAPTAGSITLYASGNDTPLKFSHQLSGSPRLGEAGEFLTVAQGMETVDVSPAGRYRILGHEYFFYHPDVAADLVLLLTEGKSASKRPGLRPRSQQCLPYWEVTGGD